MTEQKQLPKPPAVAAKNPPPMPGQKPGASLPALVDSPSSAGSLVALGSIRREETLYLPSGKGDIERLQLTTKEARQEYHERFLQVLADRKMTPVAFDTIRDVAFPSANNPYSIIMALDWCAIKKYDPLKKFVHIVPMYSSRLGRYVDTLWPGISDSLATATRTGVFAGMEDAEFGPMKTETWKGRVKSGDKEVEKNVTVTYPEWCKVVVYRFVQGQKVAFPGKVFWKEAYATYAKSDIPNEMWAESPISMLEKCALNKALKRAFPEEASDCAEEMMGRVIDAGFQPSISDIKERAAQKAQARAQSNDSVDVDFTELENATEAEAEETETQTAEVTLEDQLEAAKEAHEDAGNKEIAEAAAKTLEIMRGIEGKELTALVNAGKPKNWGIPQLGAYLKVEFGLTMQTVQKQITREQYDQAMAFVQANEPAADLLERAKA